VEGSVPVIPSASAPDREPEPALGD